MTKLNQVGLVLGIVLILIGMGSALQAKEREAFKKVKSGEYILTCNLKGGYKVIDPSMVKSYDGDSNSWTFTNGYSRSCSVTE